jgi:hypothetical protein
MSLDFRQCEICIIQKGYETAANFVENGLKMGYYIFLEFFKELLGVALWLKLPKGCRARCQKKFVLYIDSWIFSFFLKRIFIPNST